VIARVVKYAPSSPTAAPMIVSISPWEQVSSKSLNGPTWLLIRTTLASIGTLRDARVISLAANYMVGIALLEPLQARLTARRRLCFSGWSQ